MPINGAAVMRMIISKRMAIRTDKIEAVELKEHLSTVKFFVSGHGHSIIFDDEGEAIEAFNGIIEEIEDL
jgi:hypothetical protein